jgi:hypothetical protein
MARPRRGAPITPRNRIPVGLRMTPELRENLVERSGANGRSLTQEIELRLERSFDDDRLDRIEAKLDRLLGER